MHDDREIAANLMKQAAQLVSSKRGQQHGELVPSFTMIAEFWSTWINHAAAKATGVPPTPAIHLTPFDVLEMMSLMKKARGIYGSRAEPDHYIDDIGYSGLAGALNMIDTAQQQTAPEAAEEAIPAFLSEKKDSE